jgi:hypothetical protein
LIPFPCDSAAISGFGHQMAFRREVLELMVALRQKLAHSVPLEKCLDFYIPFCAAMVGSIVVDKSALVDFRRHGGSVSAAGKADEQDQDGLAERTRHRAKFYSDMNMAADIILQNRLSKSDRANIVAKGVSQQWSLLQKSAELPNIDGRIAKVFPLLSLIGKRVLTPHVFSNSNMLVDVARAIKLSL